jgi:hypothetical protein
MQENQKHNYKLTDAQFLEILSANGGLFGITAKAIQRKYKIAYSRQAVRERAQNHPEFLKELVEENIETSHLSILQLMKQNKDLNTKFKAARFYALTKGKAEFNTILEEKPQHELKEQLIKIGNNVLKFLTPWKER